MKNDPIEPGTPKSASDLKPLTLADLEIELDSLDSVIGGAARDADGPRRDIGPRNFPRLESRH